MFKGKTPHASFSSSITEDIKKNKTKSVFERVNSGMYKIKSSKIFKSNEEDNTQIKQDLKDVEEQKKDEKLNNISKNEKEEKEEKKQEHLPNQVVMKKRKALRSFKNTESPSKKQKNESKIETN